ncbi:MAG TPA: hypothetical protein VJ725_21565 [Thermoanaerobaculia bacterium]|nr:hypothetical protein [Thermoanaerobaculia bacterium]
MKTEVRQAIRSDFWSWARNDRGVRDPQAAVAQHEEEERAYDRSLHDFLRRSVPALAFSLLLPLAAHAAEKCQAYTLNGKPVVAKRTEAGNLSTTACEPEITLRLRSGRPDKRALNGSIPHKAGGGNIVLRKATISTCTVWIYEDPKVQDRETILRATDLCIDAMHEALEAAIPFQR